MRLVPLADIVRDPSTSKWLKDAINASVFRDPVDALNDAEMLVRVLRAELDARQRAWVERTYGPFKEPGL